MQVLKFYFFLFYVHGVLPAPCLCEGARPSGTGVWDSCELMCGCWNLNPGPGRAASAALIC